MMTQIKHGVLQFTSHTTGASELAQEAQDDKAAQLPRVPKMPPILYFFTKIPL